LVRFWQDRLRARRPRQAPARARLTLESLEQRTLLSSDPLLAGTIFHDDGEPTLPGDPTNPGNPNPAPVGTTPGGTTTGVPGGTGVGTPGGTGTNPGGGVPTGGTGSTPGFSPLQDAYIVKLYYDLLHRLPSNDEVAGWQSAFTAGASLQDVAYSFTTSSEFQGNQVRSFYRAYLGREPEAGGVEGWLANEQAGLSEQGVAASILASDEFYAAHGNTNAGWLAGVYGAVLGRAPEVGGLNLWTSALQGGMSRTAVAQAIATSGEARSWGIADDYSQLLRREVDPAGLAAWLQAGANFPASQAVAAIATSAEYVAAPPSGDLLSPAHLAVSSLSDGHSLLRPGASTNGDTLSVNATGAPGTPVMIFVNGAAAFRARIGRDGTLFSSLSGQVPEGTQQVVLRPLDGTATFRPSAAYEVTFNRTAPVVTFQAPAYTVRPTPTITVGVQSADLAPIVHIDVDRNGDGTFAGPLELDQDVQTVSPGNSTFTLSNPLPEGNFNVRARVVDQAGNVGVSPPIFIHVAMDVSEPKPATHGASSDDANPPHGAAAFDSVIPDSHGAALSQYGPGGHAFFDSTQNEQEPNNTPQTANALNLQPGMRLGVTGAISPGGDVDFFSFTLSQKAGVFFDIDSRETGLSTTLDSFLTLFKSDGTTEVTHNDNGYDFDTGFPGPVGNGEVPSASTGDSALYADLAPGSYFIKVNGVSGTTGNYVLKCFADTDYTKTPPALDSLPNAPHTLYLDYNGFSATDNWGTYTAPPIDIDNNTNDFSPAEKHIMTSQWRRVAEHYRPFNINVSTDYKGGFNDFQAIHEVIESGDGSNVGAGGALGVAFLNSYNMGGAGDSVVFVFFDNFQPFDDPAGPTDGSSGTIMARALEMGDTGAHEPGHAFGLLHYGGNNGNALTDAIMYTPDAGIDAEHWRAGPTNDQEPPVVQQDDEAIISGPTNQTGFRPDDFGNTPATATALKATGNVYTQTGVIEKLDDSDFFTFQATSGGATTIAVAVDPFANDLAAVLKVFDSSGTQLGMDMATGKVGGAFLSLNLTDATYTVQVSSKGGIGQNGGYTLIITTPGNPGGGGGGGGNGGGPTSFPPEDIFESNDTSDTATALALSPINFQGQTVFGAVNNNLSIMRHAATGLSDYDWYTFTPPGGTSAIGAQINYTPVGSGDLHMRMYRLGGDGTLSEIGSSTNVGTTTQEVIAPIQFPDEQILLWVYGFNDAQAGYNLAVFAA
jgi:hypothetical protein